MDEPFGALDPQTRWGMQSLLLDVSRTEDNTILFVTHDVSEAVYLADTVFVLSPRPAHILHRIDVPTFAERDLTLKSKPEFRDVEKQLLDLLYKNNEARATSRGRRTRSTRSRTRTTTPSWAGSRRRRC